MSIEKKFLKTKPACKVKFSLSGKSFTNAESICVAGEFNDWDSSAAPLKKAKNGTWSVALDLPADREYQFRYCVNGQHWVNDDAPDKLVPSGIGDSENSVIVL